MSLANVYNAVQAAITSAINSAGITNSGQVIIGWPLSTELVEVLGQTGEEYQVSIYMIKSQKATRYIDAPAPLVIPNCGLTATLNAHTITFAGTLTAPANIHTFLFDYNLDIYVAGSVGQTAAQIASAVALAVTNAPVRPNAVAIGNVVTLDSNGTFRYCNIGTTANLLQEVARLDATLQVTIWTTGDPASLPIGDAIADAIKQNVGTVGNHRYTLPDGSALYLAFRQDELNDLSQSSYSLFQYILLFDAEYGTIASTPATQVGVVENTQQVNNNPSSTIIFGGP